VPIVLKSGNLNLLEPSRPVMGLLYLLQRMEENRIPKRVLYMNLETKGER
jgi:hypothetical protein